MATVVDVPKTFGALLLGGLFAAGLSGIVTVQGVLYYKLYPLDSRWIKYLVLFIWVLDLTHSGFIWAAIWQYVITYYGSSDRIDSIPLSLSLTIIFTAILTFAVHCFFAQRIFRLSKGNWYITVPIVVIAACRLCSACVTGGEMIRLRSYVLFKDQFRWVFSFGLALSCAVDILVTLSLFFLLQKSRTHSLSLNHVIDSLILYTFEIGSLTCAATITSMICWLTMSDNLIFMGLHFVIGKLYATSLLATLNSRHDLRLQHDRVASPDLYDADGLRRRNPNIQFRDPPYHSGISEIQLNKLQINIQKSVQYDMDSPLSPI